LHLKQTIAYYFLLLYTLALLQPIVPVISNWWAHEFNNIEHLLNVHAKFGGDRLQLQVAKTSDQSNKSHMQAATENMKVPVACSCNHRFFQVGCKNENTILPNSKPTIFAIFPFTSFSPTQVFFCLKK